MNRCPRWNCGRLTSLSVCVFLVAATALALTPVASANSTRFDPPKKYYLALGDSTAFGYQASKFSTGVSPSAFDTGYVDVFASRMRAIRPDLVVVNYGCPGESTTSFITGPCLYASLGETLHNTFDGSQLAAATAFLQAHPGQVSPITVTLWGGDIREFIASCGGDFSCIQIRAESEIARIAAQLSVSLRALRAAAPAAEIIVTGPWNGNVGFFLDTDPLFEALNATMRHATADSGARFADMFPVFNPQGDVSAETTAICTFTLLCSAADSHPSDAGYRAVADTVFEVSGYDRLRAS